MIIKHLMSTRQVMTEADRLKVLEVLRTTYEEEKAWVLDVEQLFPLADLQREDIAWFLVKRRSRPVGVLRVLYNPPIQSYLAYDLKPIDPDMDVNALIGTARIAEIGRFAVVPDLRSSVIVASSLIRAAVRDVVSREFTLLVTDVFENEANSPLGFHTRVVGFTPIATHEVGELRHKGRRVTMVLDVRAAYQRLKAKSNWFFRSLTQGWTAAMHRRLDYV